MADKVNAPSECRPEDIVVNDTNTGDFKGYSLEELRYQRALVMLRREFAKQKMHNRIRHIQKTNVFTGTPSGTKASGLVRAGSIASKILTGLNYMDYILIGYSAFGTIRKVASFFSRRRK